MVRKAFILLLALLAGATIVLAIVTRWTPIHWRVNLWDTSSRVVTVVLECGHELAGGSATIFYGSQPPANQSEWSVNDVVLKAGYEVTNSTSYFARPGYGVRKFEGRRTLDLKTPWWSALLIACTVGMFPVLEFIRGPLRRRRRRKRGLCVRCGRDPSEASDSTCPECPKAA